MEIAILVGAAVLLFGADRVPKLARSIGQAKKEFTAGQADSEVAHERERAEARARAEASATRATATLETPNANGIVMGAPHVPSEPAAPQN
jgi:sec-independent protein translocase protein TatA